MALAEEASRLKLRPVAPALGAEVVGVDLDAAMTDATFAAIWRAFVERKLLLFRGQDLSPQRQVEFARRFGARRRCGGRHRASSG